jgi:hypothetical protein
MCERVRVKERVCIYVCEREIERERKQNALSSRRVSLNRFVSASPRGYRKNIFPETFSSSRDFFFQKKLKFFFLSVLSISFFCIS